MKTKTYSYNKQSIISNDNTYIVYGDNLQESIQIINWLYEYNKDKIKYKKLFYISINAYYYELEVNQIKYKFIAQSYYKNGELPDSVRLLLTYTDKPDAIIYSCKTNSVIMGFESTSTGFIGNATWQRTGRSIDFLKSHIPFAFIGYYSKKDQSQNTVRRPSDLFIYLYLILSLRYKTPALVAFSEHPDSDNWIDKIHKKIDCKINTFYYLYTLLFDNKNIDDALKKIFHDMQDYYTNIETNKIFPRRICEILKNENLPQIIVDCLHNSTEYPIMTEENFIYDWKPIKISNIIQNLFPNIKFYQMSKHCIAGITFQTKELINIINDHNKVLINLRDKDNPSLNRYNEPTIIIPIKLTKKENGKLKGTDDPYNGEIAAFSELYKQSFPHCNIILLLTDHYNNEYDIYSAKNRKTYKTINWYADVLMDMQLKVYDTNTSNVTYENKNKYIKKDDATEDGVTTFMGLMLNNNNIEPSFLNPPCGSWSDIKLIPTNKYYYTNRNEQRADIAFYKDGVYYIGESKSDYVTLIRTLHKEEKKIKLTVDDIKNNIGLNLQYKTFFIFGGTITEAEKILNQSNVDFVITLLEETESINVHIVGRE